MNISQAIAKGLEKKIPRLDLEVLLSEATKLPKEKLISHPETELTPEQSQIFTEFCNRREAGEPVAHIIHRKEFFGIELYIDNRALIPRPETELLVEEILNFAKTHEISQILEIGTGSGNIAIALAKNLPNTKITATEFSPEALEVAQKNIKNHNLESQITLLQSDLLTELLPLISSPPTSQFSTTPADIIVANLPYIGTEKNNFVSQEAQKYEPNLALFGGPTGLELYQKLFQQIKTLPQMPKLILGEVGFTHRAPLTTLIQEEFPKTTFQIKQDLAHLDRYFTISPT